MPTAVITNATMNGDDALDSMDASVGVGLQGDKAALVLSRLASRDAERKAQAEQQSADQRCVTSGILVLSVVLILTTPPCS